MINCYFLENKPVRSSAFLPKDVFYYDITKFDTTALRFKVNEDIKRKYEDGKAKMKVEVERKEMN